MADESDVEVALVAAIAGAIYPNGTGSAAVGGTACRIARGEPNAEALNADLAAGIANVTVLLVDRLSRNTTRYGTAWQAAAIQPAPTLTVSMAGAVATFAGAGGAGAIVGVRALGQAFSYATGPNDTPAAVAAAMAQRITGATASGPSLHLPGTGGAPLAVVYGLATAISEQRRQEQGFRVTVFAPTPDARTAVAAVIDQALAGTSFLPLADGSAGRLRYRQTRVDDVPGRANLWRRELLYTVEYGTTQTTTVPDMVFGTLGLNGAASGSVTR